MARARRVVLGSVKKINQLERLGDPRVRGRFAGHGMSTVDPRDGDARTAM